MDNIILQPIKDATLVELLHRLDCDSGPFLCRVYTFFPLFPFCMPVNNDKILNFYFTLQYESHKQHNVLTLSKHLRTL